MRFSRMQGGVMAVSAVMMAFQGALTVVAQFVPYGNQYQRYAQYQPQVASPYQPQANGTYRTAMAYQGSETRALPATLPQTTEAIAPGQQAAPQATATQSYAAPATGSQTAPGVGYCNAYDPTGCGNSYNTFAGGDGFYNTGYTGGNYLGTGCGCGRRWFGGVYGLYMERDGNPWKTLAFSTLATNPTGYYPTDTEFVINLTDIDNDTFGGAEFRLGATFGGGGCGHGGCGCGCGPTYAWEAAYWGLVEDEQTITVTDLSTDANRLYGMLDYRGLEYDPGTGYRSVNDYYDYAPPTQNPGGNVIRVRSLTARNRFSAQNVEVNLLRLPVLCGGSCGVSCGGCDAGGCAGGSCASGGRFGRGLGLGRRGCCDCGGPRYSVTTVVGGRYMRLDEEFMFRTDYENETTSAVGFLSHNIDAENHLIGAQLGCTGVYHLGCSGRWALHCNSVVGVYVNHMEIWNRMDSPAGGTVRYANGTNATFDLRYEDDDVAVIGELRVGGSYQYSCNWRLFGGYRMLGISGVALAFDQIPTSYITPAHTSYVDSDGSIFLHGLQAGVECTY
ncbi:MAG: BBP7 family outer membrane beta-barrel protein [Pirellulales bacterium]|nr:BBP7 family outer membrane beta-barrel protein [Pirellulales bacterium]